ncbi:hypothetical protein RhiTH_001445 [Rhizoctonia solani]
MDAMLTGASDVWNPSPEIVENCEAEVKEAIRSVHRNAVYCKNRLTDVILGPFKAF